jgi:hypothetical protein
LIILKSEAEYVAVICRQTVSYRAAFKTPLSKRRDIMNEAKHEGLKMLDEDNPSELKEYKANVRRRPYVESESAIYSLQIA